MSYIQPNSVIQLFRGINLDNRYMHTIYFATATAQNTWFTGKVAHTFNAQSYVRYGRNQVKLKIDATSIMDCTYLRFMNDRTVDMWYYAFINNVEYINENTALVTYEIDVMQTWFIQKGSVRPCMVKREHVTVDTFGLNLEHEPVGSEVYDCDELTSFSDFNNYDVVIQSTGEPLNSQLYQQGMFDGTKKIILGANSQGECETIKSQLQQLLGSWDLGQRSQDIVDMTTMPHFATGSGNLTPTQITVTFPSDFDSYVPKNKKLFMYPYSYLQCTTKNGDGGIYRWEYFDGSAPSSSIGFTREASRAGGGQIICYPDVYNGIQDNIDAAVTMGDFPKNAFTYDGYEAWIAAGGKTKWENAQQITTMKGIATGIKATADVLQTIGNIANMVSGMNTNISTAQAKGKDPSVAVNPVAIAAQGTGMILDTTGSVINDVASIKEAQNKVNYMFKDAMYEPNQMVGRSVPALATGLGFLNFYFLHCHVRADEAKRIDDFFSCYGYAINNVKTPNLTGRQYWNFVQTENCVIAGNMPASSKEAIARIFDGGITFWHNGDNVGNYAVSTSYGTINNPIVS